MERNRLNDLLGHALLLELDEPIRTRVTGAASLLNHLDEVLLVEARLGELRYLLVSQRQLVRTLIDFGQGVPLPFDDVDGERLTLCWKGRLHHVPLGVAR